MTTITPHFRMRAFALAAAFVLTACSALTDVDAPDVMQPGSLHNPSGALVERAGAIATFANGFAEQAFFTGLFADELTDRNGGNFTADRRHATALQDGGYPFLGLSKARVNALIAIGDLQRYNPTPAWRIGELFAYVGYVEVLFGENLCSGVPVGVVSNGTPLAGPTLTRSALLQLALAHFDSAEAYAAGADSIAYVVRIGRARALLDSGDVAAAAAATAGVPASYRFAIPYGASALERNAIYEYVSEEKAATVADGEGVNGLDFVRARDPRVPTQNLGAGRSGGDVYAFTAYSAPSAPIVLASGVEAQLIRAEAALAADDPSWLTTLNALRTDGTFDTQPSDTNPAVTDTVWHAGSGGVAGLKPLSDPGTAAARVDLLFRERAFWLFATGHRHGDLRRLVRQYGRGVERVFPTGPYQGGALSYGSDVTFVPSHEETNPSYTGCVDRDP
ncbi:MAG: hypothetical protein IRY91_02145 [Gemmatimonadaceae bacterium]|nr:hypothetical protein [Gemmatimonadaceae bacterium]